MQILTKKQQLELKLIEIESTIKFTADKTDTVIKRIHRKENWGIFSLVFEEHWYLEITYKKYLTILQLLKEYRNSIIDRIQDEDAKV